ncbi:hypothetical protein HG537_0A05900 [Torulaspora globosa]|uniref:Nucleoporin NDC1 n=1 Tax=Torulaspora globosa TaxID=48254 RepID=A0A7H9HM23_9SACH|nr:hypothetical protein HG537_0A05900 [Torulaspora sp. CBS 2947]
MLDAPIPLSSRYSYHTIFSDICKTRFNHLATRMCSSFTILQAIMLALVSGGCGSYLESVLVVPLRFLLLYLSSLLVIVTRKNYLHVQYRGYSNVWKLIFGQLFCVRFAVYEIIHFACSFLVSLAYSVVLGSEDSGSSTVFKQCYMLYIWVLIPTVYTLQHCLFDLDRLSFSFDIHFQPPQRYISGSWRRIFVKCTIMTLSLSLVSPFVFALAISRWWIGVVNSLQLMLLSFVVFINLEFINVAFNANMSIGCLHKGKPISSLSSTPIETLVTGLSSNKPFTKLTAFQELSYRATSSDSSLRLPIYHTRYRNTHIWPVILRECLVTIQGTNESVTRYLKSLENLKLQDKSNKRTKNFYDNDKEKLFGNQVAEEPAGFSSSQLRFPGSPPVTSGEAQHRRITLKDDDVLLRKKFQNNDRRQFPFGSKSPLGAAHAYDEPIITHETTLLKLAGMLLRTVRNYINLFFFPSAISSQEDQPQVSIIEAWCISKRRQAEKLVPQPVCHAECIISLMGLLINAIEEDPKGGVVSSVGEVLKCLERSVGALGRFADWNPESNRKVDNDDEDVPDVVSILYDLSVSAFLEIVLKYNVLLDELYLDEDVVKLSKWVLDMCKN